MKMSLFTLFLLLITASGMKAQNDFEKDIIKTSGGDLEITFIGHGTIMFRFNDLVIHVDPVAGSAEYSQLPKADIILVTHQHGDHFSREALDMISTTNTVTIITEKIAGEYTGGTIMKNWDTKEVKGLKIQAVPAYNVVHKRDNGVPFHPKGEGNGYVISFADMKVYIGGDTENFPEMKNIPPIDIAFLPMNLPYTMTPQMVADAARVLKPIILYPYHFGNTDTNELLNLLKNEKGLEVRIRNMR